MSSHMMTLSFDLSCYRLTAIQKACYRLSDRATFDIAISDGNCQVHLNTATPEEGDHVVTLLKREVLDQELREVVAAETGRVCDLLLAQAFSPVSLLDQRGETADFRDDPLGIGTPDFPQ
ncbi:His-Xaa-Ser system protein HxsD [Planctomicrobium sp. SH661]|uniref:His-Xaa-Ser system protein HxsD n=1 Tax=Planctomicrobium sp. SH661 TaxID=3448124 RepID=UPI003F5C80DA